MRQAPHAPTICLMLAAFLPTACAQGNDAIDPAGETFNAISPDETITLTGTEPFWGMTISRGQANYANPQHPEGWDFAVSRFAGNNGLGFSGNWDGVPVTITLTPGQCSDGMSDRAYPYVATVAMGEEILRGCGFTDGQPFVGDAAP